MSNLCIVCETRPVDFDERLCRECAAACGIIDKESARATYRAVFDLAGRASLVYQAMQNEIRDQSEKDLSAQSLMVTVSPIIAFRNTRKLFYMNRLAQRVNDIPGDFVECGVGRGETLLWLAAICCDSQRYRNVWGFDSFEGFPEATPEDNRPNLSTAVRSWDNFSGQSPVKVVHDTFVLYGLEPTWLQSNVCFCKGWFKDTLQYLPVNKIALLHLDCDLYQSYKVCLESLWDKVSSGGIIALDEYRNPIELTNFPGAAQAIDEFLVGKSYTMTRDEYYGKYYLVKHG